jgi:hypothetical protein
VDVHVLSIGESEMKRHSIALVSFFILSGSCSAGSLCSPKDNNARILSAPSPNAIDPQWSGGSSFVGTGWSFYVNETVKSRTGLFAKGNLHGSRGGIAQRDVYVLLSEWDCAEAGEEVTEGIDRVDAPETNDSTSPPAAATLQVGLPQTFSVVTEKGRHVWLRVTQYGRIVTITKQLRSVQGKDSANQQLRNYRMTFRVEPANRLLNEDGAVMGYELQLPRIRRGDRLIIHYKTLRPYEVSEGGTAWEDIDAPWVFDSSYSGSVRTLFTEFKDPGSTEHLGEWTASLAVNGKVLVSRKFELLDPTGRAKPSGVVDVPAAAGPLADLTGIWAHSSADCKLANSGALDKMTRFDSKQYQVVGICGNGFDYLQRAFSCGALNVSKAADVLDVETSCTLKDYDPEKKHIHIKVRDADSLQFLDSEFEIRGDYVRCARSYSCDQP